MRSATGPRKSGPVSDAGQAVLNAQQAAHVARVAVGVPAAGVDDHERLLEVAVAVEQGVDDQPVVGHHVTVAAILVIAVVGCDLLGASCASPARPRASSRMSPIMW